MAKASSRRPSAVALWSLLATSTALAASGAAAQTVGPLNRVAGGSIFGGCQADRPSGQPGTLYQGAEVEPNLAINPANPSNMLFGTQQDRWSNGGSRGQRGGVSMDGGNSFQVTSTPGVTRCQGGPWPRSSDPWVAFSKDGASAYFSALVVKESANPNHLAATSGMVVSTSKDGGVSWGAPTTLIVDVDPHILDDKNSVTADPRNAKTAYVVWDRLQEFIGNHGVADEGSGGGDSAAPNLAAAGRDGNAIAHALLEHARAVKAGLATPPSRTFVKGPTYLVRTTDGGKTWSLPQIIWDPGSNSQTLGNQVVPLANGQIRDFFTELQDNTAGQPARIGSIRSIDKGVTWAPPDYAQSIVNEKAYTPNGNKPIRSADVLFSVAVDPTYGLVYLVWEDSRFTGNDEVAFAWSPDNGFSWTAPVRINQTPRSRVSPRFQQALIPTVGVDSGGHVMVSYFDFRNDRPGAATDAADLWAATCNIGTSPDACLSNGDWANEVRLTGKSFDWNAAPLTGAGVFIGDYMSIKAVDNTLYTIWCQTIAPGKNDVYLRTVTFPTVTAAK